MRSYGRPCTTTCCRWIGHAGIASWRAAWPGRPPAVGGPATRRAAWTAHHWLAAGHREQALAACLVAGQAAEQTLAFGEAARHYRVAARLWHELGAGPADASSWTLSQVFEHAAQVSYLPGNPQ